MIAPKYRCLIWAGLSVLAAVGAGVALLNFWAAVDLGYDASPRGKAIIARWCYAALGCLGSVIGLAILSARSWSSGRKQPMERDEQNERSA